MLREKLKNYILDNEINLRELVKQINNKYGYLKNYVGYDMKELDIVLNEFSPMEIATMLENSPNFSIHDDIFLYDTIDSILISYPTEKDYNDVLNEQLDEIIVTLVEVLYSATPNILVDFWGVI